jgi:hypothetical protein
MPTGRGASFRRRARGKPLSQIGADATGAKSPGRDIVEVSVLSLFTKTGERQLPNLGGSGVAAATFVGDISPCADGLSGSSRARPAPCAPPDDEFVVRTTTGGAGSCVLRGAVTCMGKTGWPKNLATMKPQTTSADARKTF